jgi:4-hydroxy-3-methylbut-2-enyl diphosphate reductase IspH
LTKKTVKRTIQEVRDLEHLAAVHNASANWLKVRYLSRDSSPAIGKIACEDGSSVPEEIIEQAVSHLESLAKELQDTAQAMLGKEVTNG